MSVEPLLGRVDGRGSETPFCLLWLLLANPQAGHNRCPAEAAAFPQPPPPESRWRAGLAGAQAGPSVCLRSESLFRRRLTPCKLFIRPHAQHGADQVGLATVIPLARAAIAIRVS